MSDMEESDEEEEEVIVYANFEEGTVDREVFQNPNLKLKMIGLDSDTPIVQLRDSTFKGEWSDTIGTKLLLEEDQSPEQVDSTFTVTPETMLKYKCQSLKTLHLSRIFLKPKVEMKVEDEKGAEETVTEKNDDFGNETLDDVVHSMIKPDYGTDSIMKEIVNEALTE